MRFVSLLASVTLAVQQIDAAFAGCSDSQAEMINETAYYASNHAAESWRYLTSTSALTPRYRTWFGDFTKERAQLVSQRFYFIYANGFNGFTYNCNCSDPDEYGYTFADSDPRTIYLCGAFWVAPTEGTNSKAGTLIRQASRFRSGGLFGTEEITSGPRSEAAELALFDRDAAVSNAASLQYFAENSNPTQP